MPPCCEPLHHANQVSEGATPWCVSYALEFECARLLMSAGVYQRLQLHGSYACKTLARIFLRHRAIGLAAHHGKIPHPPLGQGWQSQKRYGHGSHGGTGQHEDRERFTAPSSGRHTEIARHGHISGKETCNGSTSARTKDKDTGMYGVGHARGGLWVVVQERANADRLRLHAD